jgi:hypothetical protein
MSSSQENRDTIQKVIEELSRESEQEKVAASSEDSYLSDTNSENLIKREREYKDPEKHWVRKKWLECVKEIVSANGAKICYLTLPAYYRIDVSLFLKHGLLREAPGGEGVISVAAFETDPTKFARMTSQAPKLQLFGQAALEDVMVNPKNKYYSDLMALFPFDVLNLDLTTSLTPKHEGPYSQVMQALNEILTRQAAHPKLWALFLTFRNVKEEWEQTALETFLKNLQDNLDSYPKVRDKFHDKFKVSTVGALVGTNVEAAIAQCVVKWLVDRAHHNNLEVVAIHSYHYARYPAGRPKYTITKLIFQFRRGQVSPLSIPTKDTPRQGWMDEDLLKAITQNKHADVEEILFKSSTDVVDSLTQEIDELIKDVDESSRVVL